MPDFPQINHPACWQSADLADRLDWQPELTTENLRELEAALERVRELSLDDISSENFPLPRLSKRLLSLREELEQGAGMILLRGFNREDYSVEDCERLFLGLTAHIGTPISQSAKGERVFSVRDEGFASDDPRARGPNTRKKLSFHTDRCDVIGFLCLQQAIEGGENEVVSSMAVYEAIRQRRPDLLEVLMQPYYYKRHTVDTGNAKPWCEQPIFSFHEDHFASAFLRVLIERACAMPELGDMSPIQREALDYAEEVAAEAEMHLRFTQNPGDILLLNNWVTWHRRTEFTDAEELEKRRHILRVWLSVPNNRPLAPWFEANYGATAAGAIRGGMRKVEAN